LITLWLPGGVLCGAAIGGVLASLSAVVATAVPADRLAAGGGLNMTARQLGGSLGVALIAGLIGAGAGEPGDFASVWLAGGIAALAAGAVGLALPQALGRGRRSRRES
jgi:hypothetical protein